MKIAVSQIESFLRGFQPNQRAVLFYGPDHGLVAERAQAILAKVLPNPEDPFALTDIPGDAIREDSARLFDEVAAISLLGGRRVVRIRDNAEKATDAIAELFLNPPSGRPEELAFVLVQADDLDKKSRLRALFESAKEAAAVPCYHDEAAGLSGIIRQELSARQLQASSDVVAYLSDVLRGDRMLVRLEMEKLDLYAGPEKKLTAEMVKACTADAVETSLDELSNKVALGDVPGLRRHLPKAWGQGVAPIMLLRSVGRYFQRLYTVQNAMEQGNNAEMAIKSLRPPLFFKEEANFRRALSLWPRTVGIQKALAVLYQAELKIKTSGMTPELLADRALSGIAAKARR